MTTKIVRANGTVLPLVKSCVFEEAVNSGVNLRPGCVSSAKITVTAYGAATSSVGVGEELTYYQVDSGGNETKIGVFYADPTIASKKTFQFTAWDNAAKLDTSFSARLNAIQANFPMTIADLVSEAATVAGVSLASDSWPLSTTRVQAFYADGITCRNIFEWAAEIACRFVRCNEDGELEFAWYAAVDEYRIYPSAGASGGETYVYYKQDGLDYENYACVHVGQVAIRPVDTENVAYLYPASSTDVSATDPNNDGNVTMIAVTVTDDGNGNIVFTSAIDAVDGGNGNVSIISGADAANTMVVYGNLLLTDADSATYQAVAENIYNTMSAFPSYRPARVSLFPFFNPYRAGDIAKVTDIQGVSFYTPVMALTLSDSAAMLSSTGEEHYSDVANDVKKQLVNLAENIVRIKKLKVGWAEIDTAIVDSLEANGINADWITAGALTIGDKFESGYSTFMADASRDVVKIGPWYGTRMGLFDGDITSQTVEDGLKTYVSLSEYGLAKCYFRLSDNGDYGIQPVYTFLDMFSFENVQFPDTSQTETDFISESVPYIGRNLYVSGPLAVTDGVYIVENGKWRSLAADIDNRAVIGYVDDASARSSITLPSAGYVKVEPPSLPTDAKITSIAIVTWSTSDGAFNIIPTGAAATYGYIVGTPGVTITGLQLRFWYEIGV